MRMMNHAATLKLAWNMFSSEHDWAKFCRWLVGVGDKVNFWKENWLGAALVDQMRISASLHSSLVARVSDFVWNSSWSIPKVFAEAFPHVVEEMVQVNFGRMQDKLIWQGTTDGTLSLKAAFLFLRPAIEEKAWCKTIWSDFIPPSKSFSTWRLFQHKMPTDKNLQLWDWLGGIFSIHFNITSIESILSACSGQWSSQVRGVLAAAIIHTVNSVWFCRNL
ncbi:hypothetical protein Lal_00041948 [Lupinus albus]|nr:hypothetical protein Lal_00041948 [Lupinus albus]